MALPSPSGVSEAPRQIQRFSGAPGATVNGVPASIGETLASQGRPLDTELRQDMEQRFGHDFSQVRLHADGTAGRSAQDINAHAYTVGRHIVFAPGYFAPGTAEGGRLIAHELTHVVQQSGQEAHQIFRQKCAHDAPKSSKCGVLETTGEEFMQIGNDRVVAAAMNKHLSGTWIAQVYSPPNLAKGGVLYGQIDAMKVTTGSDLILDVAEIKSRNTAEGTGGCELATREAQGYVDALTPIAPRMASISKGLEKVGGVTLGDCRSPNKEAKTKLETAGVNMDNTQDVFAWCVLNSIQNKLGKPFVKGFDSVSIKSAIDGTAGTDYLALLLPISCGKGKQGFYQMFFQMNQKGGVSYRCERQCAPKEEERKRLEKDITKDLEIETGKGKRKFELKPTGDEDPTENIEIYTEPGQPGIDLTDVAIVSTTTIAAMTALHYAAERAKTKAEVEIAKKAAERLTQELERRGAAEVARKLDSHNIEKLGTKAYQKILMEAEEKAAKRLAEAGEKRIAKKLAKKLGEKAGQKGAKELLKKGAKAIPYINAAIIAYELLSAGDAMAKGAEIEFGLSGSEADLSGETKMEMKGEKPAEKPTSDVKATDTKIDVELSKAPDMSGLIELETKKVTISGKLPTTEGAKVTVNLTVKLENTTIVFKNAGTIKGGSVALSGTFDYKDSVIEIDLPPGTETQSASGEIKREVKGAKVKITKIGTGGPGTQGETGKGAGVGKGEKTEQKPAEDPDAAERTKLVGEVQGDAKLKQIYDKIFTKKGKPDLEVLRRLAALKVRLAEHPEVLQKMLDMLQKGPMTDPIKDIIEPLEQALATAEKKEEAKPEEGTQGTPSGGEQKPTTPPEQKPPAAQPTPANVTGVALWSEKNLAFKNWTAEADEDIPEYSSTAKLPVTLTLQTKKGPRVYHFWIHGTFVNKVTTFDTNKFTWMGQYNFTPPQQTIKSTVGDEPIYFTDSGTSKPIQFGHIRSAKSKKKKK
jgi:hypothetical protein